MLILKLHKLNHKYALTCFVLSASMVVIVTGDRRANYDRLVQVEWRRVEDRQWNHDWRHHDP